MIISVYPKVTRLKIPFPRSSHDSNTIIPKYDSCEEVEFFKRFNGGSSQTDTIRKTLVIYSPKFDLSSLNEHTLSGITNHVIIQADSVYMTKPLDIFYKVTIYARVVTINKPLMMTLTGDDISFENMKIKDVDEKVLVYGSRTRIRYRSYGFLTVFDSHDSSEEGLTITQNFYF